MAPSAQRVRSRCQIADDRGAQGVLLLHEAVVGLRHDKQLLGLRQCVVPLGLLITSYITPADVHDTVGARKFLGGLAFFVPRLQKIRADAAYRGKELAEWCQKEGGWELEVVEREPGARGFSVQPRRWVVERSFARLSQNRRLAKDYERRVQTSETLIEVAATRLVLRRLAGHRMCCT